MRFKTISLVSTIAVALTFTACSPKLSTNNVGRVGYTGTGSSAGRLTNRTYGNGNYGTFDNNFRNNDNYGNGTASYYNDGMGYATNKTYNGLLSSYDTTGYGGNDYSDNDYSDYGYNNTSRYSNYVRDYTASTTASPYGTNSYINNIDYDGYGLARSRQTDSTYSGSLTNSTNRTNRETNFNSNMATMYNASTNDANRTYANNDLRNGMTSVTATGSPYSYGAASSYSTASPYSYGATSSYSKASPSPAARR